MRVGIMGTGMMAERALEGFAAAGIACVALLHRPGSQGRASELATRFGVPAIDVDEERFLARPEIDVVYVAQVNVAHARAARAVLLAGKHALVEKPFTSTAAEAAEIAALAKARGLMVWEAIMPRYAPTLPQVRAAVAGLGDLRYVQANYSQRSSRYDRFVAGETPPVFDPALSGGALYDINVYNVHLVTLLLGQPTAVSYRANVVRGIDTCGVLTMEYPGATAICVGAKDCQSPPGMLIQGTLGYLVMDSLPHEVSWVTVVTDQTVSIVADPVAHQMVPEITACAAMFAAQDFTTCYADLDASVAVMGLLETARHQAGIRFAADTPA